MGCQCMEPKPDIDEVKKEGELGENEEEQGNNYGNDQGADVFGLNNNQPDLNPDQINMDNDDFNKNRDNRDLNVKYADYPDKMLELINIIRQDPISYANTIEDSMKNIIVEEGKDDEDRPKIIYKKKVKVALTRGRPAFEEAAEKLRMMDPLPPLERREDLCIPLPETEDEIRDPSYLKNQVKILRESTNVDIFFKDLIKKPDVSALLLIVDDGGKNPGRKRDAVLNREFKYVGISSKFVGTTFVAYYAFSK